MSPPNGSGSARRFVLATEGGATDWLRKAAAGEPVTAGERNAFVSQAGAAMDALADPSIVRAIIARDTGRASASALALPHAMYRGPVAAFDGREVPVIGSVEPPRAWFGKAADTSVKTSGAVGGGVKPTLADVLPPNEAERRALWLATANVMRSLQSSGAVVSNVSRPSGPADAGLAPVVIVAVVVAVVGIVSWAVYLYEQTQVVTIRETAETARQAAELHAAQAGWMARVQHGLTHPRAPMPPPSPAEQRVTGRPYPSTPSPAEDGASQFLRSLSDGALKLAAVGAAGLVVVTVAPPVLANLADRATRAPAMAGVGAR